MTKCLLKSFILSFLSCEGSEGLTEVQSLQFRHDDLHVAFDCELPMSRNFVMGGGLIELWLCQNESRVSLCQIQGFVQEQSCFMIFKGHHCRLW